MFLGHCLQHITVSLNRVTQNGGNSTETFPLARIFQSYMLVHRGGECRALLLLADRHRGIERNNGFFGNTNNKPHKDRVRHCIKIAAAGDNNYNVQYLQVVIRRQTRMLRGTTN